MGTKVRRTSIMLAGLTLATGAVLGMTSPASAAPATGAPHATTTVRGAFGHHNWGGWNDDHWEFRGLYGSRWQCENAGRWQTRGGWGDDDYVCVRSSRWQSGWGNNHWGNWDDQWHHGGFHGGAWALYVED